jgi:D-aminopeptidase
MRARDLGIAIGSLPTGMHNAITDVAGVRVGFTTLIEGAGALVRGHGPVRTGVTVILPHDGNVWTEPVFAGCHRLNGNGELTGLEWVRESGTLMSPIGLTNTHSVGVVRDALVRHAIRSHRPDATFWALPVVGETYDGTLNDVNGLHVTASHVEQAIEAAASGPVAEGNVGSGTGMICHGFKGGIGTSSRLVDIQGQRFTVGVLVQANYGRRERLRINGVPVGEMIPPSLVPLPGQPAGSPEGAGSIIVVVATDAPLLPTQCDRLAQRAGLGIARTGGVGEHLSGDLFISFATGNRGLPASEAGEVTPLTVPLTMLSNTYINALFDAAVEATEESIVNALVAAETMSGRDGLTAHRLDHELLAAAMKRFNGRSGQSSGSV